MNNLFTIRLFAAGLLFFQWFSAFGQYANSWIDFGKEYYKVTVASDGAFRLTYNDLQNAGFPVNSVDPRRIQLYHRGVEQAIIVQGQSDAQFNPSDYIEFYGKKNDGVLDTRLYTSPVAQPHTYYNLYNDTTAYFLTWSQALVLGKRMSNFSEVNVSAIPQEPYHYNEQLTVYSNEYSTGNTVSTVLQYSQFDEGEGWTGSTICIGNSGCTGQLDLTLNNLGGGVVAGVDPKIELLLVGRDGLSHLAEVFVGPNTGALRLLTTESFFNYQTIKVDLPLLWSDISAGGQMVVRVKALGVAGQRDRISTSYIKVTYPQNFDMASQPNKTFLLESNPSNKSYIEITNPPAGLSLWDISDQNNIVTIGITPAGANASAVVPGTLANKKLFAKSTVATPVVKRIHFREINAAVPNYIIVSNQLLRKPALGYADPVKAYGQFRASPEGGSYDTLIVNVDQLYNQFNYGETSSSAIYEFMKYMVGNGDPKYLFLIGKGLNVSQGFFRKTTIGPNDFRDLVPSAGMPGSDMAFTAGIGGTTFEPAVPTGRITASTPTHVAAYLNKIKETEAQGFDALWRKELLHLSGGIQPLELTTFKQYMEAFADVAKGPYYGGTITSIAKKEPNPVELINVSEKVNEGVNFITFFGHSSPSTIDIDIGFASDPVLGYNNPGRYPGFLINGCNAGVFFSNATVFGEDWVLAANKGARSFIAHSSFGFSSTLRTYTQLFYEVGFGDSTYVRRGIGDIQKEVARRYLAFGTPGIATVTQVQQMVLLGDPAVKLFGALKPDYETNDNALYVESFDSNPVTALSDSFAIKIITRNFGSVSKASLAVKVTRTFNDKSEISYDSVFTSPTVLDTLTFVIRREAGTSGFGANQFVVDLDYENRIEELEEDNNSGTLGLFIPLSGTKNLLPYPYAIVRQQEVKLKFQNTNLISESRQYDLEVDTVTTFDSPFLQQYAIEGKVLMEKSITLLATDSLAYYWRTRLSTPQAGENTEWQVTSFTHIENGDEGWAQVHFPQLSENVGVGLIKDQELRQLKFEETEANIFVNNFGSAHPSPSATSFKIDDVEYNLATQGQPCRSNTINFVAFDKTTLVPYAGIPFIFQDPRTCGREPQVINSFRLTEMETGNDDDIIKMIDNINLSDSVAIFSIGDAGYSAWTPNVIAKMEELGISATQISFLQPGEPVVIFGKKGAAVGTAIIETTDATPENQQELQVSKTLTGKFTAGSLSSPIIGPASSWIKFTSYIRDASPSDVYSFDLIGIALSGEETILFDDVTGSIDLSGVNAGDFPLLRFVLNTADEFDQTPIQFHQWIVTFTPVAEGIVVYQGGTEPVEVREGEPWSINYSFVNISDKSFSDDLVVNFEVFNKDQRNSFQQSTIISAPAPGDSTHFSFAVDTNLKTGKNDVNVVVNDRIVPELFYENNTLELINYLDVLEDHFQPVLDVTFDDRYLVDGDFVSPTPTIKVRLWDENHFVLKTDTVGIRLFLKYPCGASSCDFTPIYFDRLDIAWQAATLDSDFLIEFRPALTLEGEYTLFAEAEDSRGKEASVPYEVTFNFSRENKIRFSEPYPNPSQAQIFFGFQASGEQQITGYELQIFGSDGRLVKSYRSDNLLPIGSNKFLWNGEDESGTAQSSGLYLYRFSVNTSAGTFSKNGKVLLVR